MMQQIRRRMRPSLQQGLLELLAWMSKRTARANYIRVLWVLRLFSCIYKKEIHYHSQCSQSSWSYATLQPDASDIAEALTYSEETDERNENIFLHLLAPSVGPTITMLTFRVAAFQSESAVKHHSVKRNTLVVRTMGCSDKRHVGSSQPLGNSSCLSCNRIHELTLWTWWRKKKGMILSFSCAPPVFIGSEYGFLCCTFVVTS